jgi:uncharacterized membrane protein
MIAFISTIIWRIIEKINIVLMASEIDVKVIGYIAGGVTASVIMFLALFEYSYQRHGIRLLVYTITLLILSIYAELNHEKVSYWSAMSLTVKIFFCFACYKLLLLNTILYCRMKPEVDANQTSELTPSPHISIQTNPKISLGSKIEV